MNTHYERYQRVLGGRNWNLSDIPFYVEGQPLRTRPWHHVDLIDIITRTYGRWFGAQGIGHLEEVAIHVPDNGANEVFDRGGAVAKELEQSGFARFPNIEQAKVEFVALKAALIGEGVTVRDVEYPEDLTATLTGYGRWWPEQAITNAGQMVPRVMSPHFLGNAEALARWLSWSLGVPTAYTVNGRATAEAGSIVWLDERTVAIGISASCNSSGADQLESVLRHTGPPDLRVLRTHLAGRSHWDRMTGASTRLSSVMTAVTDSVLLCHPPSIETAALHGLEDLGFTVLEADVDEQIELGVASLITVRPGVVMLNADGSATRKVLHDAGITTIPVSFTQSAAAGGTLKMAVLEITRRQRLRRRGDLPDEFRRIVAAVDEQ